MADTDIRCHGACVYSGCSVMCNNMREKKLRHWLPAAADACLGWCDCMRAGRATVRQSVAPRRLLWISPRVLTGGHTQRCMDTFDGQILNEMAGVGLWRTVRYKKNCANTVPF